MTTIYNNLYNIFGKETYASDNRFKTDGVVINDASVLLSYKAQLKDIYTEEEIASLTECTAVSISKANRRLRDANKLPREAKAPHFTNGERFKAAAAPLSSWEVTVSVYLKKFEKTEDNPYNLKLETRVSLYTGSGMFLFKNDTTRFSEENAEHNLILEKEDIDILILNNLYSDIMHAVNIDYYADDEYYTIDTLPLSHVFDAVRQFSDYPNSIPEKLHIR